MPSAKPAAGQILALAGCQDGLASQQWSFDAAQGGSLAMASLCLDASGEYPNTQGAGRRRAASLAACSGGAEQRFHASGKQLQRASDGECLDTG